MRIVLNGQMRDATAGMTVADLLREHNLYSQRCAIEVNLDVVPRTQLEQYQLSDGDRVEVVTLVGGG